MDTINRSLNLLYPPFLAQVEAGLEIAHSHGIMAYIFEGFRPKDRQAGLYAQGRSMPGQIVTFAQPGLSAHQYGIGVDLVFDGAPDEGIQWSWEGDYAHKNANEYAALASIMKDQGLEWLGDKHIEMAHFQNFYGLSIQEIKAIADTRGALGLWLELDKRLKLGVTPKILTTI